MKKELLFILHFLFISFMFSQTIIKGKLKTADNKPLEGASVYLNNTTIGTISNKEGEFLLKAKNGNYNLIISYLGYTTIQKSVNANSETIILNFTLKPDNTVLNEVVIKKTKYDADWKYNLTRFKQAFLGRTKLADKCEILNPKSLHFEYNYKTKSLTAFAKEPLQIKHKSLGYLITYDLVNFEIKGKQLFFSGYARYKNLRKSVTKKWKNNRLEAFNGSQMHFLRSLIDKQIKEDGFVVNQFKRVLNPDRPADNEIKMARQLIKLHGSKINFSDNIAEPKTPLDSALVIIKKARLPKYRDYLYKRNVPYNGMISFNKHKAFLNFKDYLMVIYTKEPEEENYLKGMFGKRKKASGVQTSNIVLLEGKAEIDKSGVLVNPNAIINEGYWGFEAFANMLPLDYQLPKK